MEGLCGGCSGSVQSRGVPSCACLDCQLGRASVGGGGKIGTVIRLKRFTASVSVCGLGLGKLMEFPFEE